MPRRLSNPEWVAFQNSIDIDALGIEPGKSAVVQWGNLYVLVYVCSGNGTMCQYGEPMLTDITDRSELIRNLPGVYDEGTHTWLYYLPQETLRRVYETAAQSGVVLKEAAEIIGETAGAATGPLLQNLTVPLIVLGLLFLMIEFPRR